MEPKNQVIWTTHKLWPNIFQYISIYFTKSWLAMVGHQLDKKNFHQYTKNILVTSLCLKGCTPNDVCSTHIAKICEEKRKITTTSSAVVYTLYLYLAA